MEHLLFYFSFNINLSWFKSHCNSYSQPEYASIKNLPVIIKNERIGNDRCRLHLDSGEKVEIACIHEFYDS